MNFILGVSSQDEDNFYNCVIENSNGDNVVYRIADDGRYLKAMQSLNPMFSFPFSVGFIPRTGHGQGELQRVVVITPNPLQKLSVVPVKILGFVPVTVKGVTINFLVAVPHYSSLRKVSIDKVVSFFKVAYFYPVMSTVGEYVQDEDKAVFLIKSKVADYEKKMEYIQSPLEQEEEDVQEEVEVSAQEEEPLETEKVGTPLKIVPSFIHKDVDIPSVTEKKEEQSIPTTEEEVKAVEDNGSIKQAVLKEDGWLM